jgi:predicted AAA+ superfamily ATPase
MWIKRDAGERIIDAVKTRPVVLLTGVRQAGKSSLLQHLFPETAYVTLDEILLAEEAEHNPRQFLSRFPDRVIIDEIQYAPSLFRSLKIEVDKHRQSHGKWILTGSQQFRLMENVSDSLAGRVRIINLGTLSAREIGRSGLLKEKKDLLWKGGFPEIWAEDLDHRPFFLDYIQTYLERDLRQVLNVSNLRDFRRFLSVLAIRAGQLLNYSEISKEIGVSVNTIKSWISAMETTGVVILLPPYYKNLGKRLIKAPKLYFSDTGLLASLLNIHTLEGYLESMFQGNLWENFVLVELIKSGNIAGTNLFFFRDQNGVEIDFIIEKDAETFLMEAKSSENPDPRKLNFSRIAPGFKTKVNSLLACGADVEGIIDLKDYAVFNPLNGSAI